MASDYQSDMLFHGLVKKLGKDVHVLPDLWWHHKDKKEENPQLFNEIWGSGFTIYGLLDKNEYTQVYNNYNLDFLSGDYDAVVIPIHHTMNKQDRHLETAVKHFIEKGYKKNQIIVVDGWDQ